MLLPASRSRVDGQKTACQPAAFPRDRIGGRFNPIEKTKLPALTAGFNTMKVKAVSKLVVVLSLGALLRTAALAVDAEQAYLDSCRKEPGVPVPVTVVSPAVGPEHNGATVQLEFLVDTDGKPAAFSVKSATDDILASAVLKAVKQWRFLPAEVDGKPVATKVVLPVKVVDTWELANR
jgi:TonB family protein